MAKYRNAEAVVDNASTSKWLNGRAVVAALITIPEITKVGVVR